MTENEKLCIVWGTCFGTTIGRWIVKAFIAKIMAWFSGDVVQKIIKSLPKIVAAGEKAMEDKKITPEERKQWVVDGVNIAAKEFNIQINGLTKWILSTIIDSIAKKLPSKDINVPDIIVKISKEW